MCTQLLIVVMHLHGRVHVRERENSATGHIGFLEFINAAALPFARNRCNINGRAILASIASSLELRSMRLPGSTRLPTPPATHPPHQLDQPAGAGQASLRCEPLMREPCRRSTCESNMGGPSRVCVARARARATPAQLRARQAHLRPRISATLEFEVELARPALPRITCR